MKKANYGLLALCEEFADNAIEHVITRFEPHVGDAESDTGEPGGVAFEIGHGAGNMSGASTLSYDELDELEASHFSQERCGGTIEQLVHDAIVASGESVNDDISTGIVFGQRYYVADGDDEERKVFTELEDAVVLLCTLANWHRHQKRLLREASAGCLGLLLARNKPRQA